MQRSLRQPETIMYLRSRAELEDYSTAYAGSPALRRGIRLALNVNAADILLVIYWGQGKSRTREAIDRLLSRNGGRSELLGALDQLLEFSCFGDWEVRIACENTAYLIAAALDQQNWR